MNNPTSTGSGILTRENSGVDQIHNQDQVQHHHRHHYHLLSPSLSSLSLSSPLLQHNFEIHINLLHHHFDVFFGPRVDSGVFGCVRQVSVTRCCTPSSCCAVTPGTSSSTSTCRAPCSSSSPGSASGSIGRPRPTGSPWVGGKGRRG